jgi:hypothetical protein
MAGCVTEFLLAGQIPIGLRQQWVHSQEAFGVLRRFPSFGFGQYQARIGVDASAS